MTWEIMRAGNQGKSLQNSKCRVNGNESDRYNRKRYNCTTLLIVTLIEFHVSINDYNKMSNYIIERLRQFREYTNFPADRNERVASYCIIFPNISLLKRFNSDV